MYSSYISRKTVENVLKARTKTGAPGQNPGSIKCVGNLHGSNSSLESLKNRRAWQDNEALMRDLKVDIPDNVSLGSHKDSGYRSGGSSGDRNSASSASSTSFDSPTIDNFRGYPSGFPRPLGATADARSHSSSESLSSNQSGQTIRTIQNRLSRIPENMTSSSNSSSTLTVNKSQESLVGSQGSTNIY